MAIAYIYYLILNSYTKYKIDRYRNTAHNTDKNRKKNRKTSAKNTRHMYSYDTVHETHRSTKDNATLSRLYATRGVVWRTVLSV